MNDSFRKAQANYDAMEPPEFWADDREEAFNEAIVEEAKRQIAGSVEIHAELLAENIKAADVRLMSDPVRFVTRCREIIEMASAEFATSIPERVHHFCDQPRWHDSSVADMVTFALNDHWYSPMIVGDVP